MLGKQSGTGPYLDDQIFRVDSGKLYNSSAVCGVGQEVLAKGFFGSDRINQGKPLCYHNRWIFRDLAGLVGGWNE